MKNGKKYTSYYMVDTCNINLKKSTFKINFNFFVNHMWSWSLIGKYAVTFLFHRQRFVYLTVWTTDVLISEAVLPSC
jgi:hypothetical protein